MRDFHFPGRSAVYANNGMVATSHPLAAQTALDVLKSGGNAADAAIAGAVLLGICEPQMTGIGGDMFALVHPGPGHDIVALNGSGRAPAGVDAQAMRAKGETKIAPYSVDAITIPGAVDGFCRLSNDYGKLGLDRCLAPAIRYAEEGVPVAPRVAFDWPEAGSILQGDAKNVYLKQGNPYQQGQNFATPLQAKALKLIAKNGRDGFYSGAVADDLVNSLNTLGGVHSLDDFAKTQSTYDAPIMGEYQGKTMVEHPPNGQGATAILMLNMMKNFDIASMNPMGAKRAHLEAEIAKLAYDARDRFIADPAHSTASDRLLDPETAAKLCKLIDPNRAMASAQKRSEAVHKDTVYITVIDKDRMAVSLIYSIFHGFGSGIASKEFGILFQNRGAGFVLQEGHPNELGPGKRPMHTIIPGIITENGQLNASFGVMGGAYQPCGHARYLSNMVDFGMDPQSAIDAPRCFSEDGTFKMERGYSDEVRTKLAEMGHSIVVPGGPIGGAQSITLGDDGVLIGASDPRKDGCAIGY